MADSDFDGLPHYIEEDEEEAAAEKQKRRQQSWKPPPPQRPPPKLKDIAKWEYNKSVAQTFYEYDPKLGRSFYTRVHFMDFSKIGIDEETQHGPMRYTDSFIREDHQLVDSLNVLGLEIMSSDVGYPINVYGTLIVRDILDEKCNYIFRRDRDNCQLITSQGQSLILTGPSRGVAFLGTAFFEIDLKIRGGKESDDRQFNKSYVDVLRSRINYVVQRKTIVSWLSEVDLIFSFVKEALEGTIEIKILSGHVSFCGKITARTTDVSSHMLLYDSVDHGSITVGDDRVIQLLRRVVAVSVNQMLEFNIWADHGDRNPNISNSIVKFTPFMKGADMDQIICGLYKLQVKVVWSIMY